MRLLVTLPVLLAGCLDSPPAAIVVDPDGDGGAGSADGDTGGADAMPPLCASDLTLDLRQEEDLDGWTRENGPACGQATTVEGLEFMNFGSPSTCRAYADAVVRLVNGQRLRIRLVDHDPDLSMTFSVVVGSPEIPLADRRWLYFERDNGILMFGECSPDIGGCSDTFWGSTPYVPGDHVWLSFQYQPGDGLIFLETSQDGNSFNLAAAPSDIAGTDVACVAIDLGSYELEDFGTPRRSAFGDLIFQ